MASDDLSTLPTADDEKYGFQRPEMFSTKLAGTVDAYDRHVFLCYKSPEAWPAKVEGSESDPLPKLLSSAFRARKNDISVKTKLTVCEGREGTEFVDGDVLIFPDMIKYRGLKESDVDSFVDDVIVNGKPWASGAQEILTGSHVFVCAHGSRDRRCGVCGPVLIDKFIEEAELRGLKDQVFVSPCSHIGGHKYAEDLIIYSLDADGKITGHWYSYVAPDDVPELLDEHIGKGQIIERLWRGQMGVSAEEAEKADEHKVSNGESENLKDLKLPNGEDSKKSKEKPQENGTEIQNTSENFADCCQGANGVSCCRYGSLDQTSGIEEKKQKGTTEASSGTDRSSTIRERIPIVFPSFISPSPYQNRIMDPKRENPRSRLLLDVQCSAVSSVHTSADEADAVAAPPANAVAASLSDLPIVVFVDNILSRLTVKDAAAASFSSKAWKNYWSYSPNLFLAYHSCHYSNLDPIMMIKEREEYARWVTDVIKQYKRPNLERFHICFDLDSSYEIYIDDWVKFSLQHKVQALILELFRSSDFYRKNYSYPKWIDGEFLHVLVLENVDVDDEDFQTISHFKVLRELSVTGESRLEHIRMVDSSVRVKSLVVRNCWNLKHIEICDVQLEEFQYEGRPILLDLNRVPSLLKVSLCEHDLEFLKLGFKQLGSCLLQLRTLTLDNTLSFLIQENIVFPIPQLPKLEHLELKISADDIIVLLQMTSFLKACPRLKKLSLQVKFLETGTKLLKAESLPHNNLKRVEVIGFCDCKAATDIVKYIIENAVVLEKLVINPVLPWCEMRNGRKSDEAIRKEERGRRHAISLGEIVPKSVQFVCL